MNKPITDPYMKARLNVLHKLNAAIDDVGNGTSFDDVADMFNNVRELYEAELKK